MKVQSVQLKYFNKFRNIPDLDFINPETGLARDLILLIARRAPNPIHLLKIAK